LKAVIEVILFIEKMSSSWWRGNNVPSCLRT
jgi:hypothetical protein